MTLLNHTFFRPISKRRAQAGQSLVEFVGVFPILFLTAVLGGSLVIGSHQAHIAAMAMDQIAINKLKMAQQDGAVDGGTLSGYVSGGTFKGPFSGSLIDSVSVSSLDPYTDVAIGTKQFTPLLINFVPGFTVTTGAIINHNLLQAANGGAAVAKSSSTAWVPGGTPVAPPWGATP